MSVEIAIGLDGKDSRGRSSKQKWFKCRRLERQRRNGRPGTHHTCSTSQPAQSRLESAIIFLVYPYQDGCKILQTPTQQKEWHNEFNFINQMKTAVLGYISEDKRNTRKSTLIYTNH